MEILGAISVRGVGCAAIRSHRAAEEL